MIAGIQRRGWRWWSAWTSTHGCCFSLLFLHIILTTSYSHDCRDSTLRMAMTISIDTNLWLPDQQSPYLLRYGRYHIYTPHKTVIKLFLVTPTWWTLLFSNCNLYLSLTYTLELDVKIFLLMYKWLFSFYSQEINRQKKPFYIACLYKHKLKFKLVNCNSCQNKIFHFSWKCLVDERTVFGQRFFNGRCEHGQVMYSCKEIGTRWSKGFFRELPLNPK